MEQKHQIDFVLVSSIEGMHFEPHLQNGIDFIKTLDNGFRIFLQPSEPEKDSSGHRLGLSCKIYGSFPAIEEQISFVYSYIHERVMLRTNSEISLPYKVNETVKITEEGKFIKGFSPARFLCPKDISELIEHVETDFLEKLNRFIKLIRWRQNCDANGTFLKNYTLYWKLGDGDYRLTTQSGGLREKVTVPAMFGIHWTERHLSDLNYLWKNENIFEPLGHTLLREAGSLIEESPRSSILILATALETALKIHISRLAPDTSWLMEELPSPPIFKILRDYIPKIHKNDINILDLWNKVKPFLKGVQNLIEVRNKIAHTGKIPDFAESINFYIELVSDILYLLDVLDGHEWAKGYIGKKMREALGWPGSIDKRIFITATFN